MSHIAYLLSYCGFLRTALVFTTQARRQIGKKQKKVEFKFRRQSLTFRFVTVTRSSDSHASVTGFWSLVTATAKPTLSVVVGVTIG